jgi:GDP-L-fucose synthase
MDDRYYSQKMNVLITGGNGYIASNLYKSLEHKYNITSINRNTFDLTNYNNTQQWFANKYFDTVIHTAIKGGSRLAVDSSEVLDKNIMMYHNLLSCSDHFGKFINIGSGAEVYSPDSIYGLSKKCIHRSIQDKNNYYSLRVYAIFNHRELNTRFIKNNITNYMDNKDLVVHKNKYMDFMYFDDFVKIIEHYMYNSDIPKNLDCVYEKKNTLVDIANIINHLSDNRSKVMVQQSGMDNDYIGRYDNINLSFIGLEEGIKLTYREMTNEKNMVCS